jgi:hypothetical protein
MTPDLFSTAIQRLEAENERLREENLEMRLALASGLGYFREHKIARGFHGLGVRKLMMKQIERKAA